MVFFQLEITEVWLYYSQSFISILINYGIFIAYFNK